MNNKLYLESGYVNIKWIISLGLAKNFIIGGRGTGKTFTTLDVVTRDEDLAAPFVFMRRLQSQCNLITSPMFNPFKKLNMVFDTNIGIVPIPKTQSGAIYNMEENDEGKLIPVGELLGFTAALSTFSSCRGINADIVKYMILDEFIPEEHERPIKKEGQAFKNAYETINRNRELEGQPALQTICLANSNNLNNSILNEYNLVDRAYRMQKTGNEVYIDREQSIGLFMLQNSPISKRKSETVLYRDKGKSEFAQMALSNKFDYNDSSVISKNLKEFRPIVRLTEHFTVYSHKTQTYFFVSKHNSGSPATFNNDPTDISRFIKKFNYLIQLYRDRRIFFESASCEIDFKELFTLC